MRYNEEQTSSSFSLMMNAPEIIEILHQKILPAAARAGSFSAIVNNDGYQPIFPFTLHSHSFFEWIWCVENQAFLQVGKQIFRLNAGDFYFLPPGEMHADVYTPALQNHRILWCAYNNETIGAHLHEYVPVNRQRHLAGISAPAPPFVSSLLGALQHEWKNGQKYQQPVCSALVQALIPLMLRAFEDRDDSGDFIPGKIAVRVNHYLNEHFNRPLSLAHIAHAMHVSRNYLATLYKQETGTTIGQALRRIRLEHAKKMLLETDLSAQQIARAVGYASPEHFSRTFQRQEGVPPRRYGVKTER